MKSCFFSFLVSLFFIFNLTAQESSLDSWTIGFGATNTIMHGDLTSLNSESNKPINLGFYLYINKMITPTFGFELKGQALKMRGSTQDFAPGFPDNPNGLYFEGDTFGGELNAVINLNGLGQNIYKPNRKLNFSAHIGLGYHTYNSKLYDLENDELLQSFENVPDRNSDTKSIYYTAGLGLRYNLSHRFDVELRQSANFNNEDHLDAAVNAKQVFETFFTTNLGVVFKLSKKDSKSIVWQDTNNYGNNETVKTIIEEKEEANLIDSDGDGVLDQFDKEPNTPKGALTYGNGVAVDTDRDGIIDLNDKCPLKRGLIELKGCPVEKDSDGDGVKDTEDLCPTIVGPIDNQGCPVTENTITEVEKTTIINLAKNIYFQSGKSYLRDSSKRELNKIADIMLNNPTINFTIEGHTDSGGNRNYNLQLSQNRANSVKEYLIKTRGVSSGNLTAIGYGFSTPKYTNRTSDGRQLNRRVEIKIDDNSNKPTNTYVEVIHLIIKEDTLFSIANKYSVTVDQLKEWNNLLNNEIIVGQNLIIRQ